MCPAAENGAAPMRLAADNHASLYQLRQRLAEFEQAYDLCDMIDSWTAVLKCRDINRAQIKRLKAEIERRQSEDDEHQDLRPVRLWGAGLGDGE